MPSAVVAGFCYVVVRMLGCEGARLYVRMVVRGAHAPSFGGEVVPRCLSASAGTGGAERSCAFAIGCEEDCLPPGGDAEEKDAAVGAAMARGVRCSRYRRRRSMERGAAGRVIE